MDQVKIGEHALAVARPANLEELLVGSTGCSSSELADIMLRAPTVGLVTAALRPFIAPDGVAALDMVETDVIGVARQVAVLLAPPAQPGTVPAPALPNA